MSSSCGPTTSSCNGSPRHAVGSTATRRRLVDPADPSDRFSDEEDTVAVHHHNHIHLHHHHYPPVRYSAAVLRRKLLGVPEPVLHRIEDVMHWSVGAAEGMTSRRNVGRKILAFLIVMVVLWLFVRVSFLSTYVDARRGRLENGLLRLHTFQDDWAQAQKVVIENDGAYITKRVAEKLPVSLNRIERSFSPPTHSGK